MNKEQLAQVYAYLERSQDEMNATLEELVNIESSSKVIGGTVTVANRLKELFEAEGLNCEIMDTGEGEPTLVGILGADRPGKPIVLSGHMDTIFDPGVYPPNPFKVEGDNCYGPGVLDMKGGLVIALFVIKALGSIGYDAHPLKIIISGDEEISHSRGSGAEVFRKAAEGGLCAFNMETGLVDNSICYGRKGRIEAHITIHGVEAHSGNDFLSGRNAIAEMGHKIVKLHELTDLEKGTTVTCGVIEGGTVPNSVPKFCKLQVDCRYDTMEEMERFKKSLEAICAETYVEGTTTEVAYPCIFVPYETTDEVMRFWEFVKKTAEECGLDEVKGKRLGGVSDASYAQLGGVPVLCSFGIQGQWNHTTREYALLSSMVKRGKLVASTILNIEGFIS